MFSPHKDGGKGTYIIDRVFAGPGRIKMASGARTRTEFRTINDMLTGLESAGRTDILNGIAERRYTLAVVLRHWQSQTLHELPSAGGLALLAPALETFRLSHDIAESTRKDYQTAFRHVLKVAGPNATVSDLPAILRTLKDAMRLARTPIAFNRTRAYLQSFARATSGQYSPLWTEIARVDPFTEKQRTRLAAAKEARPNALLRRPLTVAEFDRVCAAFVDVAIYGGKRGGKGKTVRRTLTALALRYMTRSLATTGMRPQEYWERDGASWDYFTDHGVRVRGTKTKAAHRVTLCIGLSVRPDCGEKLFRREFAKATEKAVRQGLDTYSLRRTFATWCESARIDASRARAYLGHGKRDVTDVYLQTDVLPFVEEDAATLKAWIDAQRKTEAEKLSHDSSHGRVVGDIGRSPR